MAKRQYIIEERDKYTNHFSNRESPHHPKDKYPYYTPKNWYLSVLTPQNSRFTHLVAIRPLLNSPKEATMEFDDLLEQHKDTFDLYEVNREKKL